MSINLDNILFYSAPTQQSEARATEKSRLISSYPPTQRDATLLSSNTTLISTNEIKNDDDDKLVLSSWLRPEATINDAGASKDMTNMRAECHPVMADMSYNYVKESAVVETTPRENPLPPVALSSGVQPASLSSMPSGAVTAAMPTLSSTSPDDDNTTHPAFHRILPNSVLDVGFNSLNGEKDSFCTKQQQPSQKTHAVNDGFMGWLQRHQTTPAKSTNIEEISESLARTAENTCSASVEPGPPTSTLITLLGQDTHCYPQSSTRQPTPGQTVYDPMPNASAGLTDQTPVGAPEPRSRAMPRRSKLWSSSAGQTETAPDTNAQSLPPAPLPPIGRQTRKRQLPIGAYAEADSDTESNNEDASEQDDKEYAEAPVNTDADQPAFQIDDNTPDQQRQPRPKRRKTDSSPKAATSRALRARQTSSTPSTGTARRSNRISKQIEANGIVSPTPSCISANGRSSHEHLFAQYDEWPLANAVLKRVTDGCVTTFELCWEQPTAGRQPQSHSLLSRNSRSSPKKPISTRQPSKRRGPFSKPENELLTRLKGQGFSWKEIYNRFSASFPGRSLGALQVHFSTKLNTGRGTVMQKGFDQVTAS